MKRRAIKGKLVDLGLSGKTAFITGGSAGIGYGIARSLIAEGASVTVCARDPERLEKAATDLGAYGAVADVTDPEQLRRAIDDAAERLDGLDMLVANAGGSQGGDLLDSTPEDWAATYALNVLHAAHAVRCAVPHFDRHGGGSVLIVSSITGWKPGPKSSYASAKAAEIHLAATLAHELAGRHVRVNALSPGSTYFEGGGWAEFGAAHPERLAAFAREDFPAGRLVTLDEVADTACFLLSPRASGINGANVPVDGAQDHPSARRLF